MHPHRKQYPKDVYWFLLRGNREHYWDWKHQYIVVTVDDEDGKVGAADWRRLGKGGEARELHGEIRVSRASRWIDLTTDQTFASNLLSNKSQEDSSHLPLISTTSSLSQSSPIGPQTLSRVCDSTMQLKLQDSTGQATAPSAGICMSVECIQTIKVRVWGGYWQNGASRKHEKTETT